MLGYGADPSLKPTMNGGPPVDRGDDPMQILAALKERGVLLVPFGAGRIRAVTHRDIGDDDIDKAIEKLREVLK